MSQLWRHQAWIVLAATITLLTNLGATRLWDQDEAFFAGTAAEMHARGDWVVPWFNDELFAHKPPLMFWMMMLGYELFGSNEFAARFFSAVFGAGTALLVYHLGRRLYSAEVGLWAGLAMISCLMFNVVSRAATPDSYLVFFSTLSLYLFAVFTFAGNTPSRLPRAWWMFASMYGAMGLAVLTKGPIGVLLPMAVIGLFLMLTAPREPLPTGANWKLRLLRLGEIFGLRNFFSTLWQMRPFSAVFVVMLVAGPWFALVGMQTDGAFLKEFFGVHNFGRFLQPMDNHRGSTFYYIPAVLVGGFPWSIFALPAAMTVLKPRRDEPHGLAHNFIACWAIVYIGFFSLASTKLPSYVLPAYPALALATACFIQKLIREPNRVNIWWPRVALGILGFVGLAALVALPVVANWQVDGQSLLVAKGVAPAIGDELSRVALLGFVPLVGAAIAIWFIERGRCRAAMVSLAITAVVLTTGGLAVVALRVDRFQNSEQLIAAIRQQHGPVSPRIAQYGYFRPSLIYYARQRVESCASEEAIREFFAGSDDAFLITTDTSYAKLRDTLPPDIAVLHKEPNFPKNGSVVVLGRNAAVARQSNKTGR